MPTALLLNLGNADLEMWDGVNGYGFRYAPNAPLEESRGSKYAGQVSSGGQTYDDATPFKRKAYDSFLGGIGQTSDNKVYGGIGLGGDDTKYFYADAKTDRGGYTMPGMSRDLVYNQIAASKTPIADGLDPIAGDEQEVPRGVLPVMSVTAAPIIGSFTTPGAGAPNITFFRVLVYIKTLGSASTANAADIRVTLKKAGVAVATYDLNIPYSTVAQMTGWKWVTLPLTTGSGVTTISTLYTVEIKSITADDKTVVGCYGGASNAIVPYFQIMTSATPFKYWANPIQKVEHVNNAAGAYSNIALHSTGFFNTSLTSSVGTAGTSPERLYSAGTYTGSIWFNSLLYIATTTGMGAWNYAALTTSPFAPTTPLDAAGAGIKNMVEWGGQIYCCNSANNIFKTTGAFPLVFTPVATGDSIGQKGSPITRMFVFQGNLWVIKPEGVFQLYGDPTTMSTAVGNLPRINPMGDPMPSNHPDTGKWYVQHQGSFFFNYRDRVFQYTPSTTGPLQVTVLPLPIPWYRMSYYHYINGLASDGINLYVSMNNLGVYNYLNQVWHPVMEFYEQVSTEGQGSGLRWVPDPTTAPDALFAGDGRTLVKMPMPSAARPFTQQIYQNHQNKCGYLITSATDMEQAEITKYIQSVVMRAVPGGCSYKIVAAVARAGTSFNDVVERTWFEGITRDSWMHPTTYNVGAYPTAIVTTAMTTAAVPYPNTLAPACFSPSDFGTNLTNEKQAATTTSSVRVPPDTDVLTYPVKVTSVAFIIYFWNPTLGQAATVGQPLSAIDTIIIKYQAIQDYVALYRMTLSCHALTEGRKLNLTTAEAEDQWDWLRQQFGRHSPLQFTVAVRNTGGSSLMYRIFFGMLQNPVDHYGNPFTNTDARTPLPETVTFEVVATTGEYTSV